MRFIISVDADWRATFTSESSGRTWQREMRKMPDGEDGFFPQPPEKDMPPQPPPPVAPDPDDTQQYTHYDLCTGNVAVFWKVYRRIMGRTHRSGDIEKFGRYLFDTLIGAAIWEDILSEVKEAEAKHPDAKEAEVIELALSWSRDENYLHRLTWEMMRGTNDFFLVSGVPKTVAITRLVAGTKGIEGLKTKFPPRLLFIIGTSLTDTQIRPGAEYMNLIRQLNFNEQSFHHKVLQRATPQQMKDEMKAFEPDIVHFICHGGIDPKTSRVYLSLELDAGEKADDLRQRDAQQLLQMLKAAGKPPAIVVLSACYSAGGNAVKMRGGHESAPLAAELVAGGIPVVIGMSGQVSDLACRLFTRRFGTALVSGEQLVKAASEGRCAAFTEGRPPQSSMDWAFPTVFMAEGVKPDYAPLPADGVNTVPLVNSWIDNYKIKRMPVFCSREEFFEAYYKLFKPHQPKTLIAYADSITPGFGRTRLLQQLAITALREGHIPCLVSDDLNTWKHPTNVAQLCVEILKAIGVARSALGLDPALQSELLDALLFALEDYPHYLDTPNPAEKIRVDKARVDKTRERYKANPQSCFNNIIGLLNNLGDIVTAEGVQAALQADLKSLLKDAQAKHPQVINENGRVLVLLDEVQLYAQALTPLFYTFLGDSGLGTSDQPVPVVMALSKGTAADKIITPVLEEMQARVQSVKFEAFGEEEYMMVYQNVLMNPFNPNIRPGISDKPWVFDYQVGDKTVNYFREQLGLNLERRPSDFGDKVLYVIVGFANKEKFAIEADDEAHLAAWQKKP